MTTLLSGRQGRRQARRIARDSCFATGISPSGNSTLCAVPPTPIDVQAGGSTLMLFFQARPRNGGSEIAVSAGNILARL